MKSRLSGRGWLGPVAIVSVLAMAGFYELGAATGGQISNPPAKIMSTTRSEAAAGRGYSAVVKKVLPAVVNISSSRVVKNSENAEGMDPFLRQFFGDQFGNRFNVPKERMEKALGSGVIVSPNGYILTNNHVVDGAKEVSVTLSDKREMKARVVGTDPRMDIAVVKIEGNNFPALTLGDSSKVQVGDVVLAIGDPFGVGETVTNGIVSALGRGGLGIEEVENFIQTDAPINPGNSGGALVDDEGHLIGINTAIVGSSGGSQGIGFAVPIDMARHDMDEIIAHGKVERGYLGVVPQDITPALAKAMNAGTMNGALIGDVSPNSPAARAGVKQGDVVEAINGQPITSANELRLKIGLLDPNANVTLRVLRNGQTRDLAVTLGEFPSNQERASAEKGAGSEGSAQGLNVETLTPDLAQQLKLPVSTKGVVVDSVSETSKAAEAGLQRGDVIEQVNHQAVDNVQQFHQAMSQTQPDQPALLLVNREGSTMFLAM
ncbi:MAG: DegQ family serine endoprotease [Bryobacterales bacterium]|nr:DegQ family serine endoprotease [Bryobacterales bacterium]MBV9399555.1 DegQ family serine endoprotease [Bryobacterales bacterium]